MGCAPEQAPSPEPVPARSAAAPEHDWVPADAPVRTTYLRIGSPDAKPRELRYSEVNGLAVFEGDIILGRADALPRQPGEVSAQGISVTGAGFRWPNAVVPFTIDANLPDQARVTNAIRHWQERTNVRFIPRNAGNAQSYPDFVTFRPGTGCSSPVGKQGGEQFVTLEAACSTGNTIHEIGHAVGLWHEQSREDRDTFVTINWANIQDGRAHNFNQHITDGDDLGAYDYGSIMHYGAFDFSRNGQATITVLTAGAVIGQRNALSNGDINAIFTLYPDPGLPTGNRFFTMDFDGDRDDDLVIRGPGGEFMAYRAVGGTYQAAGDLVVTGLSDMQGWAAGHRFFVMDYDGDGDDDLLARSAWGDFFALRSDRTRFVATGVLYSDPGMADAGGWNEGNRYYVMDYDADGDDDLVGRYASGAFVALRSERTHLAYAGVLASTSLTDAWGWNAPDRFFVADSDGDGDDDLLARNAGGLFNLLRSDRTHLTWVDAVTNTTFRDP